MASASVISAHPGMPILSWLWACGLVIPGILSLQPELVRPWYAAGCHGTRSITVMNTISLLLLGGHALTSPEGGGPCSLSTFDYGVFWPSGFPINVTRIITKSGDRHRSRFGPGYGYPGKIRCKRKQRVCFYLQKNQWRFPEWARERATRDYLGKSIQQDSYWSKDLEYRLGACI